MTLKRVLLFPIYLIKAFFELLHANSEYVDQHESEANEPVEDWPEEERKSK